MSDYYDDDVNYEEIFKSSSQNYKQELKKKAERKNSNFSFEEVDYSPLIPGTQKVYRLLGLLPTSIKRRPFDPKIVLQARILDDYGKQMRVNFPTREENPKHIMWKIIDKVLDGTWEDNTKLYKYAKKYPEIFNMVFNNNTGIAYDRGWIPSTSVIMPAIDRESMEWHKNNKRVNIISKKKTEKDDKSYYEIGIPITLYNNIFNSCVQKKGFWENYDIIIEKYEDDPYYAVFKHADDIESGELREVFNQYHDRPLTEEEKSWERPNLDKMYPIVSYKKLYERLSDKIKRIDKQMGTDFFTQLEEEYDLEMKSSEEEEKEENKDFEKLEEESIIVKKRTRPEIDFDVDILDKEVFEGINKLTIDEKNLIIGYDDVNNRLIFKKQKGNTLLTCAFEDDGCEGIMPRTFTHCPNCGKEQPLK